MPPQINEQRGGRFASPSNIPTICEALHKAALDPRVDGIYFKVGHRPLNHPPISLDGAQLHAGCVRHQQSKGFVASTGVTPKHTLVRAPSTRALVRSPSTRSLQMINGFLVDKQRPHWCPNVRCCSWRRWLRGGPSSQSCVATWRPSLPAASGPSPG